MRRLGKMDIGLMGENLQFVVLGMVMVLVAQFLIKYFTKRNTTSFEKVSEDVTTPYNDTIIHDNLLLVEDDATQDAHHVAAIVAAIAEFRKQS